METSDGWGHDEGHEVYFKLLKEVESRPGQKIYCISLRDVRRTDASFPRESVVELAKRYRGDKGFYLVDLVNQDLIDNWIAAADKKEQPLMLWDDNEIYRVLGPQPSKGNRELFEFAMSVPKLTTSEAANALNLKLTNTSSKLKQLIDKGYLLRQEEIAPSGGIEFMYFRIK